MTFMIDRRLLIQAGTLGLAALATPGVAAILTARGFTHGVASGEPAQGSVLLWTRYAAANDTVLRCEMARDLSFAKVIAGGEVTATGERDHTARLTVSGLQPGTWYYYRFIAPDGSISPVGRTRTLPDNDAQRFAIGLFSCSNLPFGWFNAYAHAVERGDLDLIVHVGDYLYEYAPGTYPDAKTALPGRLIQPDREMVTLADYRLRHASYRMDPDLRRLHQCYPMIAQWDDHELTNDAWTGGAQNHQSETEGDWETRKAIAERVYREWMPVSDARWSSYQIGTLATIFRAETRISGRDKPLELAEALAGRGDIAKAMTDFRDGPLNAPERSLLGAPQEAWLTSGLKASKAAGTRWQVLAQQIVMGEVKLPLATQGWVPPGAPEMVRTRAMAGVMAAKANLPYNFDSWGGYPAARSRVLNAALEADSDLIVLSGDSHNAWGQNLTAGGRAAGVEFGGHSVTSPGFESFVPHIPPADVAAALRADNPGLVFSDTSRRGYVTVTLTPTSATGEWHFMDTIRSRSTRVAETSTMQTVPGRRVLSPV